MAGSFIQPYSNAQTETKLLVLQRKDPNLAAAIGGALGSNSSNTNTAVDAKARNVLLTLFSQEIYGGGGS